MVQAFALRRGHLMVEWVGRISSSKVFEFMIPAYIPVLHTQWHVSHSIEFIFLHSQLGYKVFKRLLWFLYWKKLRQLFEKILLDLFNLCVWVFSFSNMSLYHLHRWYPQRSEDSIESLGSGVIGGCKPLYGY